MEVLKGFSELKCKREQEMALELFSLVKENKITELAERNFNFDAYDVYFNTSSGYVFLSDEDMNTIIETGGILDLYISTPDEGHEDFFYGLMDDWENHNEEDKKYLYDLATEELREQYKDKFKELEQED